MIINALNSGSDVFMADFEDSCSPTFHNLLDGQVNLKAANEGTIEFKNPDGRFVVIYLYDLVATKILLQK